MDRISRNLFEKICSVSSTGRYVILTEEEFFDCFPDDGQKSDEELQRALKTLTSGGFIDLKYSGGNMYCVAPLKKYVPEEEIAKSEPPDVTVVRREEPKKSFSFAMFLSAFLGGAAGSLIICLVFAFARC